MTSALGIMVLVLVPVLVSGSGVSSNGLRARGGTLDPSGEVRAGVCETDMRQRRAVWPIFNRLQLDEVE
ncbi:MAG TPA: hypothetical protein VL424_12700 [Pararobbsia sp.]|nr:hypothetical protein [Pararobbsia sp.]